MQNFQLFFRGGFSLARGLVVIRTQKSEGTIRMMDVYHIYLSIITI